MRKKTMVSLLSFVLKALHKDRVLYENESHSQVLSINSTLLDLEKLMSMTVKSCSLSAMCFYKRN